MKLACLYRLLGREDEPPASPDITSVVCDSRLAGPGALFVAIRGGKRDGHEYIAEAVSRGAAACFVEDPAYLDRHPVSACFTDARAVMAAAARLVYGNPAGGRPTVAVTGTNGKTTTTHIVEAILSAAGRRPGVLGTIAYRCGDLYREASHTTPQSCELQAVMAEMVRHGADAFVMEASSHAIEQGRVAGLEIDCAVFTNLTRDHLDYHGDMERYFTAKLGLFTAVARSAPGCVNVDDEYGREIARQIGARALTYGFAPGAMVTVAGAVTGMTGTTGTLVTPAGAAPFRSPLVGRFNLSNIMAAAAAGVALGVGLDTIVAGISDMRAVPGRLEPVGNGRGIGVYVDYAHTGDALENVLLTARGLTGGRLIVLFGCGGDRDRGKRPVMGEIAARHADLVVVTSDNPRTEAPLAIIGEILGGIPSGSSCHVEPDRAAAIRLAISLAAPGDVVVLAGKGHEDYQIVGEEKFPFDDRLAAARALADG